jgi:hypothetical protein
MPNEPLLRRLEELRERYGQQHKAAAALQAALKAVTTAHAKAQKALREVGAQPGGTEVGAAQAAFAQWRLKEEAIDPLLPELRRDLKSLTALLGALKEAAAALRSAPVDVVRLDRAISALQAAPPPEVRDLLPELSSELELAQRGLGDEFGYRLRAALADLGLVLGGRAPKFEIGRFELEANFAKRALVLRYGKDSVVPHVPITVEAVIRAYQRAAKEIGGRAQDGSVWIAQFHEAYQLARRKRDAGRARVNIVDCYLELVILRQGRAFFSAPSKRTFADYSRAQFLYDFYEFAQRRRLAHQGQVVRAHVAVKAQTDSPAKSMWIVEGDTPYDGRYFADVEFVKD